MVPSVSVAGVDTVSYAYRPEGEAPFRAIRRAKHRDGAAGALVCDERGPDGGRLMSWPGHGLIAYETRLGALLAGNAEDHSLAPVAAIGMGSTAARLVVDDLVGVDLGEAVEVRRFDLAAEIRFDQSTEGLAFMASMRGICPPRARVTHEVDVSGAVMTAYVRTEKRGVVLSRVYDKGRESRSDPPGRRIRVESQNRPPKSRRCRPHVLAELDLAPVFGRTLSHYLTAERVVAAGPDGAVAELVAKAHRGELSLAKAERLVGSMAFSGRLAGRPTTTLTGRRKRTTGAAPAG